MDKKKLNNNAASSSSSSEAGDANPDQRGEKGEDRETAPDEPRGRRGKGVTTDGGAATTGGVGDGGGVVVEESQAKRRKSGNPGASQTRGTRAARTGCFLGEMSVCCSLPCGCVHSTLSVSLRVQVGCVCVCVFFLHISFCSSSCRVSCVSRPPVLVLRGRYMSQLDANFM